jgi:uncharacterized protein (TIGR03437 family)
MRGILAVLLVPAAAWAAAPSYTAQSIVNAGNYAPGPFAPNSVLSLFGTDLLLPGSQGGPVAMSGGDLAFRGYGVEVYAHDVPAPLLFVSPTQINFLVPSNIPTGGMPVRVVRQGVSGPLVTVSIVEGAPALFTGADGFALASHADNSLITGGHPARPGEIVVLWATGLGKTDPNTITGTVPRSAATLVRAADLKVMLDGAAVEASLIKYNGVTPYSAGLYQINFAIPDKPGTDPEIRVGIGGQTSPAGLRLAVR